MCRAGGDVGQGRMQERLMVQEDVSGRIQDDEEEEDEEEPGRRSDCRLRINLLAERIASIPRTPSFGIPFLMKFLSHSPRAPSMDSLLVFCESPCLIPYFSGGR